MVWRDLVISEQIWREERKREWESEHIGLGEVVESAQVEEIASRGMVALPRTRCVSGQAAQAAAWPTGRRRRCRSCRARPQTATGYVKHHQQRTKGEVFTFSWSIPHPQMKKREISTTKRKIDEGKVTHIEGERLDWDTGWRNTGSRTGTCHTWVDLLLIHGLCRRPSPPLPPTYSSRAYHATPDLSGKMVSSDRSGTLASLPPRVKHKQLRALASPGLGGIRPRAQGRAGSQLHVTPARAGRHAIERREIADDGRRSIHSGRDRTQCKSSKVDMPTHFADNGRRSVHGGRLEGFLAARNRHLDAPVEARQQQAKNPPQQDLWRKGQNIESDNNEASRNPWRIENEKPRNRNRTDAMQCRPVIEQAEEVVVELT